MGVAAGYIWRGKAVPVLRAISKDGKLLWCKELASRFDSAVIAALTLGPQGLFAVIAPLDEAPGKIDFDILRFDLAGNELSRRSVTAAQPDARIHSERTIFASALMGDSLYIAASYSPTDLKTVRNDFGFVSACYQGRGARVYRVEADDLAPVRESDLAGLRIHGMQAGRDGLVFAGSEQEGCAGNSEKSLFGQLGADLAPRILWKDGGAFYGHLVSVARTPDGYAAIADINEPLDTPRSIVLDPAKITAGAKHFDFLDDGLSEAVFLRFDAKGGVTEKDFLGNGLPQFAQGFVQTGAGGFTVYGSDGFNPWIETIN